MANKMHTADCSREICKHKQQNAKIVCDVRMFIDACTEIFNIAYTAATGNMCNEVKQ